MLTRSERALLAELHRLVDKREVALDLVELYRERRLLPEVIRNSTAWDAPDLLYIVGWRGEAWVCEPVTPQLVRQGPSPASVARLCAEDMVKAIDRLEAEAA